ncbi:MAG: FdtA/QdtA family cupin domain-containing protein [Muribaculaceae bacterium]|nr:FdtA/QdtA family cupin domain-containing protein [Muribaculaceae bacterium]
MNCNNHRLSNIDECRIIETRTVSHANGKLSVMENLATAPFSIRRVYYLYDLPAGAERGGHSHVVTHEIVIALNGSFDVVVDDGKRTKRVTLNRPDCGLLLPAGIWRTLDNFSSGSICLVLASEKYEESDYVRDYEDFKRLTADK